MNGRRVGVMAALFMGAVSLASACEDLGPPAASDADCRARPACRKVGQCTLNRSTKKCVVGSNQDCADSAICGTQNRCIQVGETCGKEAGQ